MASTQILSLANRRAIKNSTQPSVSKMTSSPSSLKLSAPAVQIEPSTLSISLPPSKPSISILDDGSKQPYHTEFEPFPRLPAELRLRIWGYMLPGPRVVEINEGDRLLDKDGIKKPYNPSKHSWTWTRRAPVGLHVCKESRIEAEKVYELVSLEELRGEQHDESSDEESSDEALPKKTTRLTKKTKLQETKPQIYFNFDIDTLYISAASLDHEAISQPQRIRMTHARIPRVKYVAIDPVTPRSLRDNRPQTVLSGYYHHMIRSYPQLETLSIVRDWTTWNSPAWMTSWGPGIHNLMPRAISSLTLPEICALEVKVLNYFERRRRQQMRKPRYSLLPRPRILHKAYFGTGEFVRPSSNLSQTISRGKISWENDGSEIITLSGAEVALLDKDIDRMMGDFHEANWRHGLRWMAGGRY